MVGWGWPEGIQAYRRMWLIRRLKTLGRPTPELIIVLTQQIVSICEFGAAYWGCMITKVESNVLERCLKTGLHIIFQDKYVSFSHCLQLAKMSSLKERRLSIIARFSLKAKKNPTSIKTGSVPVRSQMKVRGPARPAPDRSSSQSSAAPSGSSASRSL